MRSSVMVGFAHFMMVSPSGRSREHQNASTRESVPATSCLPGRYSGVKRRTDMRRIRWGMVGGGRGGFIGEVHRMAARLDDRYVLLAGALSSDPDRARLSAADCGIGPDRAY